MTMRFRGVLGLMVLSAVASTAMAQDAKTLGKSEYFPLAVGTSWEYKTSEGKVVSQIVKHEEIGGVMCARLEATTTDNKKTSEYLRITNDGVYRVQANDQNITPPLRFLKLPLKSGDKWQVESKVLGKTLKGEFVVSTGEVNVPAGKYSDVIICKADDFTVDGQNLSHTYYFAKGVGIVKQVIKFAGQEITLELEKFTPGSK